LPELPEVETVVRSLTPHLVGRSILSADFYSRRVTRGDAFAAAKSLSGAVIVGVRRRGKQIFFDLDQLFARWNVRDYLLALCIDDGAAIRIDVAAIDAERYPTRMRLVRGVLPKRDFGGSLLCASRPGIGLVLRRRAGACCPRTARDRDKGFGDRRTADGPRPGPLPGMPGVPAAPAHAYGGATPGQPGLPQPTTTTGGGGYSVDVERAPQAIADLRLAAQALKEEARRTWNLANITPPGLDVVSANAVWVLA